MLGQLRFLKRLVIDLPRQLRLGYCLMRDPRVPAHTKALFGAGLGVIMLPRGRHFPTSIPLLGELDALAVLVLALRVFIAVCPDDVVLDVEQAIIEQRSVFDDDLRCGETTLQGIVQRLRPEPNAVGTGDAL